MKIYPLILGPVQTSCYIISNDKKAIIIDPADQANQIIAYLKKNQLELEAILLTHGHFDHIGAVNELGAHYSVPVYAHKKEKEYFEKPQVNLSPMIYQNLVLNESLNFNYLTNGEAVSLIGTECIAYHVPGHTSGSLCYYFKSDQVVFTGDTLFHLGIGRTDFIYGNEATLLKNLKEKILTLPDETVVYPGHGECTTIGYEKQHNMFLKK